MYQLLAQLNQPEDIKKYSLFELENLAQEIRQLIIETVSKNGGHLAPSLGTVELTLALYSVFKFPQDKLVWDVGHQAYTHKIITGRRDSFKTLRQKGGITGFPNRNESKYDAFGVGHASTSISAALGMAVSRDLSGRNNKVIAVLGDGALTGGEAFEALNHAGELGKDLIVILNDNEMSIDRNVGAMSEYLSRIRLAPQYKQAKHDVEELLSSIPRIGSRVLKTANQIKDGIRSVLVPGALFEEMGFHYIGPLDGHNISFLQDVFARVREMRGPILLHVHTMKGKGYTPAENNPGKFHGVGKFDVSTGESLKTTGGAPSYTSVFSQALIDLAEKRQDLVAVTAAMPSGTGLNAFKEKYPQRFLDVGIAEEHAVTLAAGMAADGKHPVVALYSTFAQRGYDQILHDICLQNLPVTLCLDRAGLVGEDGPTHHGVFDFSYLRHMPNMTIFAPKDENELRQMLGTAVSLQGPSAIRYPRGAGVGVELQSDFTPVPVGKADVISSEGEIAILSIGVMNGVAQKTAELLAGQGIKAALANMRFVKPLDEELLVEFGKSKRLLVTIEENVLAGGFGSAVAEFIADHNLPVRLMRFGLPDAFVEQGSRQELLKLVGLQPEDIVEKVCARLQAMSK